MIVKMFGDRCEVAVHDFTNLQHSLIHLAGNVTGRKIDPPITDLVLNELTKKQEDVQDIPSYKNAIQARESTEILYRFFKR